MLTRSILVVGDDLIDILMIFVNSHSYLYLDLDRMAGWNTKLGSTKKKINKATDKHSHNIIEMYNYK